jgi:long-subunit fatty acid transport protein
MPASGGMAGASIAQPQDLLSGINANPASLTQFTGTQFLFRGALAEPTFNMTQTTPIPLLGVVRSTENRRPRALRPEILASRKAWR